MKKLLKRWCTDFLVLATVVTALPSTLVHAERKQYWTESAECAGIIEKVMNYGSIGFTFNEGMMKVEGETAYCIDINTDFENGYKTRANASSRMSSDQISDVALSLEYVKQYGEAHKELSYNGYLLDGAYMQTGDKAEQIKGLYVTQITEDGDLAVLSGSNQFSVSDKVIRGGVKIQKNGRYQATRKCHFKRYCF